MCMAAFYIEIKDPDSNKSSVQPVMWKLEHMPVLAFNPDFITLSFYPFRFSYV